MTTLPQARTGGQLIADALIGQGADMAFCVPGESYLEILDGLYDRKKSFDLITCRHEQGAANMAEAYGKLTGRPGVCLVTRGPGACNASIGVHTAYQDSTPMIMIVGQVPRPFLGREAFQEVDYEAMFGPLAKWAYQIKTIEEIPGVIKRAFETTLSGRPGPVVLAVPEDILREKSGVSDATDHRRLRPQPDPADLNALEKALAEAERPIVMVGGGGWTEGAKATLQGFIDRFDLPGCCGFRRHDSFDTLHHNFVGDVGIGPDPALLVRIKESDLLIVIGARLGEMTSQGYSLMSKDESRKKLVHIHADSRELGRVFPPRIGIVSGMTELGEALLYINPLKPPKWGAWREAARADYEANRVGSEHVGGKLDLRACMAILDAALGDKAVITVDAGNYSGWPQRFLSYGGVHGEYRRLLGPTSGAMGYAVPAAVAASAVCPDHTVIGCVGDGSFGMTGQELATAVQFGLKPVIIVFNNGIFGTIRMHQESRHPGRVIATDLGTTDFAAQAHAHGAESFAVEKTEEFAPALERALKANKAALIELRMDPDIITTRTTLKAIREKATAGTKKND